MRDSDLRRRVTQALLLGGPEDLEAEVNAILGHLANCRGDAAQVEFVLAQLREGRSPYEVVGSFPLEVDGHRVSLRVERGVMPPGADSQIVADAIFDVVHSHQRPEFDAVIDVGCGSGILGIAALISEPSAIGVFVDVSRVACQATSQNIGYAGLAKRSLVIQSSGLGCLSAGGCCVLVTANLPFVPTGELKTLIPRFGVHAPLSAIDGGPDGLAIIRSVVDQAAALPRGSALVLQHSRDQAAEVRELLGVAWRVLVAPDRAPFTIASLV